MPETCSLYVNGKQRLELKLESVFALDYRSILLLLVKSYMRAHLEDLAVKDATEMSEAANRVLNQLLIEMDRMAAKKFLSLEQQTYQILST
jgi:hypothetical protein